MDLGSDGGAHHGGGVWSGWMLDMLGGGAHRACSQTHTAHEKGSLRGGIWWSGMGMPSGLRLGGTGGGRFLLGQVTLKVGTGHRLRIGVWSHVQPCALGGQMGFLKGGTEG